MLQTRILSIGCLALLSLMYVSGAPLQEPALTPRLLRTELKKNPKGADAGRLAERIREMFGKENLAKGPQAKTEELTVAWAVEAPAAGKRPEVRGVDTSFRQALERVGTTNVYAAVIDLQEGDAFRWIYEVDGKRIGYPSPSVLQGVDPTLGVVPFHVEVYSAPPEARERPGVPKGKVIQMPRWKSRIFEGTERDWWLYVPAQYTPEKPACLLIAQDGGGFAKSFPTILDNLIAAGDLPVMIGVFVNPGTFADARSNRSVEYDTLSDRYARFLLEEILPEVQKTYRLRSDPQSRMIFGISSGGICSWTAAWERPDQFHKVLSWVGSFTNIQHGSDYRSGGHNYPALIRKLPKKDIRIFLQAGERDLDNEHGNWPLANLEFEKALTFKGYDYKFIYGKGFHSDRHGMAILPDSLRWLWRDHKGNEN